MKKQSLRAEREFGLIVGGVLMLLSAWWLYRGKFHSVAPITLPLGSVLVLLGLVFPRVLVYPNRFVLRQYANHSRLRFLCHRDADWFRQTLVRLGPAASPRGRQRFVLEALL